MIVDGESGRPPVAPPLPIPIVLSPRAGDRTVVQAIREAARDDRVRAVVVYVNSPGGSASASEAIHSALRSLDTEKPVVVAMGPVAASGGYYVAAAADRIYVTRSSIVGSVGVRMDGFGLTGLMQKLGVERRLRCTGGCNLDVYTCRTTDFTCTYSPALHQEIVALVQQGKTADEVVGAFVAKYGETALMAPPKRGFNWAAYLLPGIVITIVGIVIAAVLIRRSRVATVAAVAQEPDMAGLSPGEAARLKAELDRLES